ncbi:MAG: hypothetical protein Ct9H300mP1_05130 [Planctomycetaceae bacterium]|nr:MAG: hypothetical protein Ct9H300mP1_05130 [Planctomycetaceae bacterium]
MPIPWNQRHEMTESLPCPTFTSHWLTAATTSRSATDVAETSARCLEWCGLDAPGRHCRHRRQPADSHAATVARVLNPTAGGESTRARPGEPSKSLAAAESMFDSWSLCRPTGHLVVAVGGGVVGTRRVRRSHLRPGIRFVQVPTTLWPRSTVPSGQGRRQSSPGQEPDRGLPPAGPGCADRTATLETLPERDYRSGLAEVIKYG